MPKVGSDGPEFESDFAFVDNHKDAWKNTLEDAERIADERRESGWDTLLIPTGHTGPESVSHGDTDRFGFVQVIPGNKVTPFEDFFERGEFPKYDVYLAEVSGRVFMVTELLDPTEELCLLIAGSYRLNEAEGLIQSANREDTIYTHVRKLDATHLGSFEHREWEKFFPKVDPFLSG